MKPNDGIERTIEYQMITEFYGARTANRSQVPLMNHINEGLYILSKIGASISAKRAFCLHPLLQDDEDLKNNWLNVINNCDKTSIMFAMEYRNIANQYLSYRTVEYYDEIALSPNPDIKHMLIADKIQNYKDFLIYHHGRHPRSDELVVYFENWLVRLQVDDFDMWLDELKELDGR